MIWATEGRLRGVRGAGMWERLRKAIGAVDQRVPMTGVELIETTTQPSKVAETTKFEAYAVRWPVFDGVYGEAL